MLEFPYTVNVLRVEQPMGTFYVAILPAKLLLEVAFSDALSATLRPDSSSYELSGTQRLPQPKRMQPIADYINRIDAAFPNAIILAANYRKEDGLIEDEETIDDDNNFTESHRRWFINESDNGICTLTIPTRDKLVAIIDGQHRLFAFALANKERLDMNLICSIFLDLPKPYQAHLFATINSTQKPVDRSLTYELFGYNIEEEKDVFWSPDKLAVYLTRRLAVDTECPLYGRIIVAPKNDSAIKALGNNRDWKISTAVVVDGVMRLISTNPKKDNSNLLNTEPKTRKEIEEIRKDKSPLRKAYINYEDIVIYTMTLNYLKACKVIFWTNFENNSFIVRTVGVQAIFDILWKLAGDAYLDKNISVNYFIEKLKPAIDIDFGEDVFRNSSGSGRSTIRRKIESLIDL